MERHRKVARVARTSKRSLQKRREENLSHWLRHLRVRKGLSAVELSRRAGLGRSYVTKVELGQTHPKASSIEKLANALELGEAERVEFHRLAGAETLPRYSERATVDDLAENDFLFLPNELCDALKRRYAGALPRTSLGIAAWRRVFDITALAVAWDALRQPNCAPLVEAFWDDVDLYVKNWREAVAQHEFVQQWIICVFQRGANIDPNSVDWSYQEQRWETGFFTVNFRNLSDLSSGPAQLAEFCMSFYALIRYRLASLRQVDLYEELVPDLQTTYWPHVRLVLEHPDRFGSATAQQVEHAAAALSIALHLYDEPRLAAAVFGSTSKDEAVRLISAARAKINA